MRTRKPLSWLLALTLLLAVPLSVAGAEATNLLMDKEVTITMMQQEHPAQAISGTAPVLDWIFERTGIRIDLQTVPSSDYTTKVNTLLATNSFPDIVSNVQNMGIESFYEEGIFADLMANPDWIPNIRKVIEENEDLNCLFYDGKLYGFTNYPYERNATGPLPMIRADILAETGLDMPTSYDELYEVMLKMKELYPQSYPWGNRGSAEQLLKGSAYGLGSGFPWADANMVYFDYDRDQWVVGPIDEAFIPALDFIAKCYTAGLIDPEYTSANADWQEKMSTGKSFFMFDNASFAINFNLALAGENPDVKFVPVPPMTNASGQTRLLLFQKHEGVNFVIREDSPNKEAAIRLVDWLYTDEGRLLTNFGIEGEQYEMVDGVPTLLLAEIEKAIAFSDPWRGFMGQYGLGGLGMSRYNDERSQWPFMTEETREWYAEWEAMGMETIMPKPAFTPEESEELADIATYVSTIFKSEIDKYITGTEPAENWSNVQQQMLDADAMRIQEIYNQAYDRNR